MSVNTNKIAISFDIEDWFSVRNMREVFQYDDWNKIESRVHIGLDFILNELEQRNIKATFFVLGWIAEKYPELVKKIALAGHEIGSHGYSHTPVDLLIPQSFESDLVKSLDALEKATGKKIKGFRAPSFSITHETIWALDILKKHGISYDSSIFSTNHPDYGIKNFPTRPTRLNGILELPLFRGSFIGISLAACGGGYFRLLPYWVTKRILLNTLKEKSLIMYFHPWEFDPDQPRVSLGLFKKFRHYIGLRSNRRKFQALLDDFEFISIEKMIETQTSNGTLTEQKEIKPALLTS